MEHTLLSKAFSPAIYNSLLSVEDSDDKANSNGALAVFLEEAMPLFHRHGMQHRFGVGLLHKHFDCGHTERMVQYREVVGGEEALVTRPVHVDRDLENAVPVVWSLIEGKYHPLEYSTDPLAGELYGSDSIPQPFLDDVSGLLRNSPAGSHVGLAVVNRTLHNQAPAALGALEFTGSLEDRDSVIVLRDREEYKNRTIRTSWGFAFGGVDCNQTCSINASGNHVPVKHVPKTKKS